VTAKKNDSEKIPLDLLPFDVLEKVGYVLQKGAEKYTEYGECNCHVNIQLNTQKISAETAMSANSGSATLSTPNVSSKIAHNGLQEIREKLQSVVKNTNCLSEQSTTDYPWKSINNLKAEAARCVELLNDYASTTTTTQEPLEDVYASTATSQLAGSKSQGLSKEHANTCPALRIVRVGKRNWENGFAWSRLFAAVLRHLFAWGRGERVDAEFGASHLDHALVSLMFLRAHELRKIGTDDVPGVKPPVEERLGFVNDTPPMEFSVHTEHGLHGQPKTYTHERVATPISWQEGDIATLEDYWGTLRLEERIGINRWLCYTEFGAVYYVREEDLRRVKT
jgi:hypothetical protein